MIVRRTGPSRWFYALAPLVLVVGLALAAYFAWAGFSPFATPLGQLQAPGSTLLSLQPGTYWIVAASESSTGSDAGSPLNLDVTLVSRDTGAPVPLTRPSETGSFPTSSSAETSLFQFTVDRPGTYTLTAAYRMAQEGPPVVLVVLPNVLDTITAIGRSAGFCLSSVLLSGLIVLFVFVKRRQASQGQVQGPSAA